MKVNVNKSDIIWSYISVIVQMFGNIIILPLILKFLNENEIGLYYIFISICGITTLFDFGFSVSFARNITYCWSGCSELKKEDTVITSSESKVDFFLMKKILLASKAVYGIISVISLIIGLTFGTIYISKISNTCENTVLISWIVYAFSTSLSLFFNYYSSYLRGVGNIKAVNIILVVSKVVQLCIMAVLLANDFGLLGVGISGLCYNFIFAISSKYAFYGYKKIYSNLKNIKVSVKQTIPLIKTIWFNTWREGIISFSNYILNQSGTIICSAYFSLYETGLYSLTNQIVSAIANVSSTLYNTYQPSLQSAYANRDSDSQKKYMSVIVCSFCLIYFIGMIFTFTIGKPIIKLIKPSYELSYRMIMLTGLYQFILKFRNCYTSYFSSTNRLLYVKSFITSAVICIVLSFLSAEITKFEIYGLLYSQIISQLIFNAWYWTIKVHKELKLNFIEMFTLSLNELNNFAISFRHKKNKE